MKDYRWFLIATNSTCTTDGQKDWSEAMLAESLSRLLRISPRMDWEFKDLEGWDEAESKARCAIRIMRGYMSRASSCALWTSAGYFSLSEFVRQPGLFVLSTDLPCSPLLSPCKAANRQIIDEKKLNRKKSPGMKRGNRNASEVL